jgi:hypothetical protein
MLGLLVAEREEHSDSWTSVTSSVSMNFFMARALDLTLPLELEGPP